MRERIQNVLKQIAEHPEREALWLNTVSLMEFIGARKISRTVADRHPTLDVLQHLADETRHALAFKRLACEVAGGEVKGYLCTEAAKTYFQTLDRALSTWAQESFGREDVRLSYLLTTTMIEQRAMQIYPLYKAATRQAVVKEELGKVVAEEQSHRRSIEEICVEALAAEGQDLSRPKEIEAALFDAFLGALEAEVTQPVAPVAVQASAPTVTATR
jgi:hypothetical protein